MVFIILSQHYKIKCFLTCLLFITVSVVGSSSVSPLSAPTVSPNATLSTGTGYKSMTSLYTKLLNDYDTRVRPRTNLSESVNVTGLFSLTGILEFDTASQKLTMLGYFIIMWSDEILVWNPVLHDGISVMKFPLGQIWTPALMIQTSFMGNGKIGSVDNVITVWSDGKVLWAPEDTYKIICDVNIQFYPFDKQSCEFYMYMSDTVISEVDLAEFNTDASNIHFKKNSEWGFDNIRSEKIVFYSTPMIHVILELKRRHDFIVYTIIAPLVLLSVLNVGVFIVPIDSGEKGSIAVTIFLSYGVFISTISDELPHNSLNISYILTYILLLLLLSVTAVVYAYVQSFIYARYANETVTLGCLRKILHSLHKVSPNTAENTAVTAEVEKDQDGQTFVSKVAKSEHSVKSDGLIWNVLLRRMDVVVFVFFFLVVIVATVAFFGCMIHGAGD